MPARPTRGASRRDCWERSVSFVQSADSTVAMGVHDCGAAGEGSVHNCFSVVISDAHTVATITVPEILTSVPFVGIPTTMVLLSSAVPLTIHIVFKKGF